MNASEVFAEPLVDLAVPKKHGGVVRVPVRGIRYGKVVPSA